MNKDSFKNLFEKYKNYLSVFFIFLILSIAIFYLFLNRKQEESSGIKVDEDLGDFLSYETELDTNSQSIYVDVSGAVKEKGVYEMEEGERVKNAIEKAGGFTEEVDEDYISKNLNQAALVSDGQKIYIPFKKDQDPNTENLGPELIYESSKVNINSASESELDSLYGIGEKRASDILKNRPYNKLEDLVVRKIIPQSVFEEIENEICL